MTVNIHTDHDSIMERRVQNIPRTFLDVLQSNKMRSKAKGMNAETAAATNHLFFFEFATDTQKGKQLVLLQLNEG